MPAFATPADLAARLGIELTAEETTRAETLLELASGLIRRETGQTIDRVTDDTLVRRGTHTGRLRLPQRPVVSVTSVAIDGETVDAAGWYLEGDELVHGCRAWGGPRTELTVIYTHGFDPVPDEVRAVSLEAVVRVWVNPGAVGQESYGSEQVTYPARFTNRGSDVGGLLLLRAEAEILRNALGRTSGSVALR